LRAHLISEHHLNEYQQVAPASDQTLQDWHNRTHAGKTPQKPDHSHKALKVTDYTDEYGNYYEGGIV
jgi:phage-related minor tail protein